MDNYQNNLLDCTHLVALNPKWSLIDFSSRVQQIRQQLEQDKIQKVALWIEDASQFTCVLLACLNTNCTVLLPPNLLPENKQWIDENADVFITSTQFNTYGILQKIEQIQPLVDKNNPTEIWLKTSGSSGNAKIIKKTAKQMWKEAEILSQILPFDRGNHIGILGSVSVQHLYGLTFRIFLAIEMGWILGREQLQYPEYLIAESYHYPQVIWISSPTLLTNLNIDNIKVNNLTGVISSGGVLHNHIGNHLRERLQIPLVEIYGSTETGAIAFRQDDQLWQSLPESTIGLNNDGVLWVESAWISQREQTADAIEINQNGFQLLGRSDRIVKLGDKRVSLVRIEQDLLSHPWVIDCYIAIHPEKHRPVAWVALSEEGINTLKQNARKDLIENLKQHLMQTQERFTLPRFWRFCLRLPRNSQSKIQRKDFEKVCFAQQDEIN
ncbi:class I adenylate-forming enzyme family protein [Otariodibacter oris]|uniref:Acyl-CoA synthetase (AMP-forming)/AMP-acid ligase II n=1 Tax=Otariodibacter oris TaxID=1032623 RepID=A0A420XGD7_9PAST|nr:class I adenylate-forming enzyme family protein [Otariodibacter oris]QGM79967.1 AMP-binding protein [Otariodibacter oris]RKR71789.1 acyl-CoA synthetase (AMP-forming)/AMP-acid ligase II [Otariodibacter oris]